MSKNVHPPWQKPPLQNFKGINVYNSMTSKKENFCPIKGNLISWYACGPTVYSSAHLGHARAYMTFDIIRRILEDYFGYDINYVMNITDVDDKIILRARRNYLLKQYLEENSFSSKNFDQDIKKSFEFCKENALKTIEGLEKKKIEAKLSQKDEIESVIDGEKIKFNQLEKTILNYEKEKQNNIFLEKSIDSKYTSYLAEYLDSEKGSKLNDLSIFKAHSTVYEKEFLEDMKNLNIKPPDCLTRVTEFIPEIINFINQILHNNFAYESNGSIYFDIASFRQSGAFYPKLRPRQFGNEILLSAAEGSLSTTSKGDEKRNAFDFALWKKSKPGEPFWKSPWGNGRPGWHIECSVMASCVLGAKFDIHSGGEDLCFPHHDNEIAQAEAFYGVKKDKNAENGKENCENVEKGENNNICKFDQWVNYFLHAGHLGIDGLKMAKSLKNFITIRQALKTHTAGQIRLCFLLQSWNKKMDYSTAALQESVSKERNILEFFSNTYAFIRQTNQVHDMEQKWNENDKNFNDEIILTQKNIHDAFCNNFDYPSAIKAIFDLIQKTNKFTTELTYKNPSKCLKNFLAIKAINLVQKNLKILGLFSKNELNYENFNFEPKIENILTKFCDFRAKIRQVCLKNSTSFLNQIFDIFNQFNEENLQILLKNDENDQNLPKNDINTENGKKLAKNGKNCKNCLKSINSDYELIKNAINEFLIEMEKGIKNKNPKDYFLKMADKVRDETFIDFGVKIEDVGEKGGFGSFFKKLDKNLLILERNEKKANFVKKEIKILKNKLQNFEKTKSKMELIKMPIESRLEKKYGMPFKNGLPIAKKEISGKLTKKIKKDLIQFKKEKEKNIDENFETNLFELNKKIYEIKIKLNEFEKIEN